MSKKKIVIFGPFGDHGGRDVEANIIAKSLEVHFDTTILSTGYMTENSFALSGLQQTTWKSIPKELYHNHFWLRNLSLFSKTFNKGSKQAYGYLINSFSKKTTDLDGLYWKQIREELVHVDLVLLCVQLTTKFLKEIVFYCQENNIPCIVRTTGTIRDVPAKDFDFLKEVSLFVHHSEANANNLNKQLYLPYAVIDQCALTESSLLENKVMPKKPYRFGYLGRLSAEKGIVPIAHFFSSTDFPFVIAGDGPQKEEVLDIIKGKADCSYLGLVSNENIHHFFEQIDVLVIPSFEESGPLVGLEAMAAGKLIVSTKVGAMEERLNGLKSFWFTIENVYSLQKCIEEINDLTENEYQQISIQLQERYKNEYSTAAIALKYKAVVQKMLS